MSNNDSGAVEAERETYNYSPAAGLGQDTAESDRVSEPVQDDSNSDNGNSGEVAVTLAPGQRGQYRDEETGLTFRRGTVHEVSESDAERLLSMSRRRSPLFVRADS